MGRLGFVPYLLIIIFLTSLSACTEPQSQAQSVDEFFRDFTDEWIRQNPNQAVRTQYFQGEEQDELSRQLTPVSAAWRRDRLRFAQRGLDELAQFDLASLTDAQRLSADVMRWQLQSASTESRFSTTIFRCSR